MKLEEKTIELARQSVGVTEETPNWGRWVRVYLKFVGIFSPAPWCAAFLAYKVHQAAGQLGIKATWPKAGYVQSVVSWAKKRTLIVRVPRPNAVFVVWHPELKRYAHIGFIVEVRKAGNRLEFLSVEGNSNTDGSREGKAVVSQWRTWNDAKYICILIR